MQQGRGKNFSGPMKVEPRPRAISPGYAGQIGIAQGSHVTDHKKELDHSERMHAGRGFKAPPIGGGNHSSGSQKRHG